MTPVELPPVHATLPATSVRRVEAHEQRQDQRRRQPAQTPPPAAPDAGPEHVDIHV